MYESTAANDTEDCNTDQALDVPVYAVPDKVRSKVNQSETGNFVLGVQRHHT